MSKVDEAIGFLRSLPPERGEGVADLILTSPKSRAASTIRPRRWAASIGRKRRLPAATSRRTSRCVPSGRSMGCEAYPLHPVCGAGAGLIIEYIAANHPGGARNVQRRIQTLIANLAEWPEAAPASRNRPGMRRSYAIPYPYAIDYRFTDDEIIIFDVRRTARKTET